MPPEYFESPSGSRMPAQVAAIKQSRELSQIILGKHPEIAQLHRDGMTHQEIAIKYKLDRDYNVSMVVAKASISLAIKILIPDESERDKLSREHISKNGIRTKVQQKGIHGLSKNETISNAKLGGIGGKITFARSLGIHAMTPDERKSARLKGGIHALQNKKGIHALCKEERTRTSKVGRLLSGKCVPWDILTDPETGLSEGEYCDRLIQNQKYQFSRGGKTQIQCKQIAQLLNEKFHALRAIRTENSVWHRVRKIETTSTSQSIH